MPQQQSNPVELSPVTRLGDVAAMLRVMRPLRNVSQADHLESQRRLLADLCKFIAVKLGTLPAANLGFTVGSVEHANISATESEGHPAPVVKLAPRLRQTLNHLLDGDSEKQVAYKLKLSPHTVHVYVKSLYRRFNVNSRAELMSRHVRRPSVIGPSDRKIPSEITHVR